MKFAVTGASGFIGSELIDALLAKEFFVTALFRDAKQYHGDDRVKIVEGNLENKTALKLLCDEADFVINLAGVTHPRHVSDYNVVNVVGASNVANAAKTADATLIHISSLSAREPSVSPYAKSKRQSEDVVSECGGSWVSLRLPAIYGPNDTATLPLFKAVAAGWALAPRTDPPARATILHVSDAASSIIAAALEAPPGAVYEVSDGTANGRSWAEIGDTLGNVFGKSPRHIRVPKPIIVGYHSILTTYEHLRGKAPSVRAGQVNEFFHTDWVARKNLLSNATNWRPAINLEAGFTQTIDWYRENGLL